MAHQRCFIKDLFSLNPIFSIFQFYIYFRTIAHSIQQTKYTLINYTKRLTFEASTTMYFEKTGSGMRSKELMQFLSRIFSQIFIQIRIIYAIL